MAVEAPRLSLTKLPSSVTVQVVRRPYWVLPAPQDGGLFLPLLLPKSPGLVKVPQSYPLIQRVMSDFQLSW